jgi:hypothetical protein
LVLQCIMYSHHSSRSSPRFLKLSVPLNSFT